MWKLLLELDLTCASRRLTNPPDRWICQSPLLLSNYSIYRQEADDYLALLFFPLLILHCHESDTN